MALMKTESRYFTWFVGLSALLVASWAAIFSVTGLSLLYSAYVGLAMGVLEYGKIITVSYLYRYWNDTVWWLRDP